MAVITPEGFESAIDLFSENYRKVLDCYIPRELRESDRNVRAISIGCGFALELKGLQQVLPNAHIEAIDIDESTVRAARRYNTQFPEDRIRVADATQKESFGGEYWDLVMVRNAHVAPKMGEITKNWAQIFRNSFDRLKQGGFLYLTTLNGIEMQGLLGFLSEFPLLDVTSNDANRTHLIKPPIDSRFPFTEDYIAVLKKVG